MEPASPYRADELGQYRSLSTAAVLALVLGMLSSVAFASLLLLIVPMAAIAVAVWALANIRRSEGGRTGVGLARCGLALAVFFAAASVARVQVRVELLQRQADVAARRWLALVAQGQTRDALGLLTPTARSKLSSPPGGDSTVPIFADALDNAQLEQEPFALALSKLSSRGELILTCRDSKIVESSSEIGAVLTYEAANSNAKPFVFTMVLMKSAGAKKNSPWRVNAWQLGEESSTAENIAP